MRKQAFSRRRRMTERQEFLRLFDNPKVYRGRAFQAFWKENDKETARLGITIKGRPSSIWRVRIKRAAREWFRLVRTTLGNNDINIVVRVPEKLAWPFLDAFKQELQAWKPIR